MDPNQLRKYEFLVQQLIAHRKKSGITQLALAEKLKRPQSFVSKYERAERRLDLIEMLEVCEALKISIPQLIRHLSSDEKKS